MSVHGFNTSNYSWLNEEETMKSINDALGKQVQYGTAAGIP